MAAFFAAGGGASTASSALTTSRCCLLTAGRAAVPNPLPSARRGGTKSHHIWWPHDLILNASRYPTSTSSCA